MTTTRRIVFAMTGATGTLGGIASANLNALHAILTLASQTGCKLSVLSFGEGDDDRPSILPESAHFSGFRGNKVKFGLALVQSFRLDTLFIFDHVRLAMPLSPLLALGQGKCVIFAHGSEAWKRVRPMSRWLFRRAALCLTNSQFTLKKMRERLVGFNVTDCMLGLSPIHTLNELVPEAVEDDLVLTAVDGVERELGEQMLLLVGRMDPGEREKGHSQLLNVWPEVLNSYPRAQLVFAGPGADRAVYSRYARMKAIASSVFIPGALSVETLQRLYRTCYGLVMPSKQEGFGLVYLEAMNHAKPCIGCHESGGGDIIVHGETGLLIDDPENPSELRAAIERLLESQVAARRMGIQGWARLQDIFTPAHAQRRLCEKLTQLV